ncbi:MAG: Na/Pi cotransporter family protein [Clostridia bacterium]|nr:Na/Pi cotransporter family protein [Clostridia bacterium]
MDLESILKLLGGVALFLYGMKLMGNSLEKLAGSRLKKILGNLTSNKYKGFILGLGVTAAIQSSAATIGMVVGFVNSGLMSLVQATGVIFGANLGTSVTGWIISASGIKNSGVIYYAVLAVGVFMFWFLKNKNVKNVGLILTGFSILMIGMQTMSGAVSGVADSDVFSRVVRFMSNPLLGLLLGIVFTVILQSSSASVGVIQSFAAASPLPLGLCIPFVMGANIGTCSTVLISSIGATRDARRVALLDLLYNTFSVALLLPVYWVLTKIISTGFIDGQANAVGIAVANTAVKVLQIIIVFPLDRLLVKTVRKILPDKADDSDKSSLLDERLLVTPSVALGRARQVVDAMAVEVQKNVRDSFECLNDYSGDKFDVVVEGEDRSDMYEDKIGTYLVKLSSTDLNEKESREANFLLRVIGDYERTSDHAMNVAASAQEMHEKKITFTGKARAELSVMMSAVDKIIDLAFRALTYNDIAVALEVEPLEEVVDNLKDQIRQNHITRLQRGECTIELGFVLTDVLTDLERIADHCSNLACYVIESAHNDMDVHEYLNNLKKDGGDFAEMYKAYKKTYSIN